MIEVNHLVKTFPEVRAVNDISFHVPKGICFGMLGPNGAGKTTTMEIMEGVQKPTSGDVLFRGGIRERNYKQKIGIQFQTTALPDFLTVYEVLKLFQSYYNTTADIDEIVELCSLKEYLHRDTHKLSGGQRQRMLLGLALVNDPEVLFLDEPTTGLDPQARQNFWNLVKKVISEGRTVVLSTHYMEEAYQLCEDLIIMDHGKIIAQGSPEFLLKKHFNETVVELPMSHKPKLNLDRWKVYEKEETFEILTTDTNELLRELMDQNIDLSQINIKPKTLDDLFLELTGKDLRN